MLYENNLWSKIQKQTSDLCHVFVKYVCSMYMNIETVVVVCF